MKSVALFLICLLGLSGQASAEEPSSETIRIYVSGAVIKNGSYDVPVKMAFVDAILQAGGPGDSADLRNVKIYRSSAPENGSVTIKLVTTADYTSIINGTGRMPDLKSGDIITVGKRLTTYPEKPSQ